jgi:hypothetical protein
MLIPGSRRLPRRTPRRAMIARPSTAVRSTCHPIPNPGAKKGKP